MAGPSNSTIGALKVILGLDTAQFQDGLKKSQKSLNGFSKIAAGAGAAIGTAMVAVAGAIAVGVKNAIDHADDLGKAAQKVGVTVEQLSRLEYAAKLSDVSLDGLSTGLKKLSVNLDAVAAGAGGKAGDALQDLGISVKNANGTLKTSDQVLTEVAGKFASMRDGATKTGLAVAIFGKAGSDLIPMLNSGSAGLKEMGDEAERLGLVIDDQTAKSAEQFNDSLTRLQSAVTGATTQMGVAMLPTLEALAVGMAEASQNAEVMNSVSTVVGGTMKTVAGAVVIAGTAFYQLGNIIGTTVSAALKAVSGDFKGANDAILAGNKRMFDAQGVYVSMMNGIIKGVASPAKKIKTDNDDAVDIVRTSGAKIVKATKKSADDVDRANQDLRRAVENLNDDLLSDGERFAQEYSEGLDTLQKARAANLVSEAAYLENLQKLRNKYTPQLKGVSGFEMNGLTSQLEGLSDGPVLSGLDRLQDELQQAADAADEVAFGIEDIFYGLHGNNWAQAAAGITRALSAVQKAFSEAGTSADKFAAISGLAQGVGSVIGGTAGSAISGAASGALTGFQFGGPIGAVAGGVIGGIMGIFSGNKAKKAQKAAEAKAKADEAAAKAAAEAARLQQIANDKRALEIQIMEASGNVLGALAERRKDELAAADDTLDPLLEQLYKLQDAADKAAKALDVANERRSLEIQYMEATGNVAGALAAQRADELANLDESNRGLQTAIFAAEDYATALEAVSAAAEQARDAQVDALQEQANSLRDVIGKFRQFSDSLGASRDSLQAEAGINYGAASAAFRSTAANARLGNEGALGSLQGVSEQFLAASRKTAKSQFEFNRDQALVLSAVSDAADTADRTANIAQGQLDGITATVAQLQGLDLSVKGVQGSVEGLGVAILAQIQDADLRVQASVDMAKAAQLSAASTSEQLADLRTAIEAVAMNTGATARTLDRWDGDGQPEVRDVA